MDQLTQYHNLFLSRDEVKEIFRIGGDKALLKFCKDYGIRKKGRYYLTSDVKKVIRLFSEEVA